MGERVYLRRATAEFPGAPHSEELTCYACSTRAPLGLMVSVRETATSAPFPPRLMCGACLLLDVWEHMAQRILDGQETYGGELLESVERCERCARATRGVMEAFGFKLCKDCRRKRKR